MVLDKNGDGIISEKEIDDALRILKRARQQKNNDNMKADDGEEQLVRENFV